MAKLILISSLLFIVSSFLLPLSSSQQTLNLRLYLQDQFNTSQPISYGDVFAFEDPLTMEPSPTSTLWGQARGTIAFTNANNFADIHVSIAYIFEDATYNGSTVIAVGRNDVSQATRDFAIVGGTGFFKMARGVVVGSTYSEEPPIFIYDLEIVLDGTPRIEMKV